MLQDSKIHWSISKKRCFTNIFTMIKDKPTFPSAQTGVGWSHLTRFQRKHNDFPETIEDSPPPTSTWKFPRLHQKHLDQCSCKALLDVILLVVATPLKNISQIGNLFQVGVKTKNFWNHHLVIVLVLKFIRGSKKGGSKLEMFESMLNPRAPTKTPPIHHTGCLICCKIEKTNVWNVSLSDPIELEDFLG